MTACKYDCGRATEAGKSRCRTCRRSDKAQSVSKIRPGGPKILFLDIETSPNIVYTFGLRNVFVGIDQIIESTRMMCFAAKWLGDPKVIFHSEHDAGGRPAMAAAAHALLDECDVLVHWNGQSFDTKHLNREFLEHGLTPPSPFKQVDLLLAARKQFRFPSNKLAYVSEALGLTGKESTGGFSLWPAYMAGETKALKKMRTYNERDVTLLEELMDILLPWIPNMPHRHLYGGTGDCQVCGHDTVVADGLYRTPLSVFQQFKCGSCGSWSRSSKRIGGTKIQAAVLS